MLTGNSRLLNATVFLSFAMISSDKHVLYLVINTCVGIVKLETIDSFVEPDVFPKLLKLEGREF